MTTASITWNSDAVDDAVEWGVRLKLFKPSASRVTLSGVEVDPSQSDSSVRGRAYLAVLRLHALQQAIGAAVEATSSEAEASRLGEEFERFLLSTQAALLAFEGSISDQTRAMQDKRAADGRRSRADLVAAAKPFMHLRKGLAEERIAEVLGRNVETVKKQMLELWPSGTWKGKSIA